MVSDNSSDSNQVERLRNFCAGLDDSRLHYFRPPEALSMPRHWEWMIRQALGLEGATHFACLTDRMIFKDGELETLRRVVARHPERVVSYNHDKVNDYEKPVTLEQNCWTGKTIVINSAHLLGMLAGVVQHAALPRMLNCVVPRRVLDGIIERYGSAFDSTAPDMCFAFRCLEREDSIIYLDKAVSVHYALDRSNGASQSRGVVSGDHADFLSRLDGRGLNYAAPVPGLDTIVNTILHEYCLVKEQTQSPKFPGINRARYFSVVKMEVGNMEDGEHKRKMQDLLDAHDDGDDQMRDASGTLASRIRAAKGFLSPHKALTKLLLLASTRRFEKLWRTPLRLLRVEPPDMTGKFSEFDTTAEAIEHANRFPLKRRWGLSSIEYMSRSIMAAQRRGRRAGTNPPHEAQKSSGEPVVNASTMP